MIHEKNPTYKDIVEQELKYKYPKYECHCGHDEEFWKTVTKAEFGDLVLCNKCNRYFAKIRNLAWVTKRGNNHLGDKGVDDTLNRNGSKSSSTYYITHVHVRVT